MVLKRLWAAALALVVIYLSGSPSLADSSNSRTVLNINPVWRFHLGDVDGEPYGVAYDDSQWELVSLPHSHQVFSANLNGFREKGRNIGWYRRMMDCPRAWEGKKLLLEFQGAMEVTTLWVNGHKVGRHDLSGFDSFSFDITSYVKEGRNLIAIAVDNRINQNIPPDGNTMDYVLFGGLYRDVFLHVTDPVHLTFAWEAKDAGVRITVPEISEERAIIRNDATVRNDSKRECRCTVLTEVRDRSGKLVSSSEVQGEIPPGSEQNFTSVSKPIVNPYLWSPDNPYLYQIITIVRDGKRELDRNQIPFGLRWMSFDKTNGFSLNGHKLKLIGVNYHQTWPFIGAAVPNSLYREDAEQMKAMGVNWVRLSHYPHDPDFLQYLDELGLLALEEPPTWSEKGNQQWMTNLELSYRAMIRRDRNHPSIMLWGACINHHGADPVLVKAAVEEDPTRDRGQDTVPTPMNFERMKVTGNGALAIEHTGHTFPAARGSRAMTFNQRGAAGAAYRTINREYEQAERHWEQINSALAQEDNAGLAVWCMYDYNTLYNVNEPGLVWHGVCDLFRIPKFSYYWQQSELTTKPMAYVVRIDSTHAAVFSNCEKVKLMQDEGEGYKELGTKTFPTNFVRRNNIIDFRLKHPPINFEISGKTIRLRAIGLLENKERAEHEWRQFGAPVALTLATDRNSIIADGADLSRIVVTAVDANGVAVENCDAVVNFAIAGLGQLIGENPTRLRSGKMIILVQSAFAPSKIIITASSQGLESAKITVNSQATVSGVDMPKDLVRKQPSPRELVQ